jgi:AGZA family xanthine/uracil permease-like MFS transporter
MTAVVTGGLFLAAIVLAPLATMVPIQATSPILILVGILMLDSLRKIDFGNFDEMLPALLVVIIMPFTYSIANGIAWGIIVYTIIKLAAGKKHELHPIMYVLSALFILRYLL